ncbi:MAG: DUF1653 domain-containing protein [Eubacterium sp.]|nr:DUF1653 domain-containing protein [Candidatus Colimonas fimequi]
MRDIKIGKTYRHFKGNLYKVLSVGVDTETGESRVVYCDVSDPSKVWVRPLDMFVSAVDRAKYPAASQEYRFELVDEPFQWDDMIAAIRQRVMAATSTDPVEIAKSVMAEDFMYMHGPAHHFLDGAAFIRAFVNAGGGSASGVASVLRLATVVLRLATALLAALILNWTSIRWASAQWQCLAQCADSGAFAAQ